MDTLFLLGDSIRMFYARDVERELAGLLKVVTPGENCRFTLYTLRNICEWAKEVGDPRDVAVIHWNNGLWDATRHTLDGECLVSLEEYARNLERILGELRGRFPRAKIIWATITPVAPALATPNNEDIDQYNRVALEVMARHRIPVNDLHALIAAHPEYLRDDLIHETEEGARALAAQVKQAVLEVMDQRDEQ